MMWLDVGFRGNLRCYLFSMAYYLKAFTPNNLSLGEVKNARSIYIDEQLNRGGNMQFVLNITDAVEMREILIGSFTQIRLYKEEEEGPDSLIWAGEMSVTQESLGIDTGSVNVYCRDWTKLLSHLKLQQDTEYTNVNEGQILFNLLQQAQDRDNADYGFVPGLNTSTNIRTRQYRRGDDLLKLYTNMTQIINGVDFYISPLKSVNIYDKRGTDRTGSIVFEYGQNIKSYSHSVDYTQLINHMQFEGEGGSVETADDLDSQAQYRVRDGFEAQTDISESSTLDGKARDRVSVFSQPEEQFSFSTEPNSYPQYKDFELGDIVLLVNTYGFTPIIKPVRVYGRRLSIDDDGEVSMHLAVSTVL